jgi:hypothetical protein
LISLIESCQADGSIPSGDPHEMARAAWATVHGLSELANAGGFGSISHKELARITRYAAGALVRGFAEEPARA